VYAHGGGMNAGAKDDEAQVKRNFSIALARLGCVVLNINHRLANEARRPAQAQEQDMAAAVRSGTEHADCLGADGSHIVLADFSSGGYLAAQLAADAAYLRAEQVKPLRRSAVLAVSGFFDLDHLARAFLVRRFIVERALGARGPA
jgi:acetyl esterase/lipase